jgi:hypothetical protein
MGRYSKGGSYNQNYERTGGDWYRLYWTVDYYYADSRLRYPRVFTRDTDEAGVRRFCKRWGITFDEPASDCA